MTPTVCLKTFIFNLFCKWINSNGKWMCSSFFLLCYSTIGNHTFYPDIVWFWHLFFWRCQIINIRVIFYLIDIKTSFWFFTHTQQTIRNGNCRRTNVKDRKPLKRTKWRLFCHCQYEYSKGIIRICICITMQWSKDKGQKYKQ